MIGPFTISKGAPACVVVWRWARPYSFSSTASTAATTTVTCREGGLRVQDGPFAETKEALAGVFVLDVPDLDAAIGWAEKCPGAQWGVIEVRPTATALVKGEWTR